MNREPPKNPEVKDELVDVLTAISVVSMRLATKLSLLEDKHKPKKGALRNEPRYVNDHHRTSPCRRCY